MTMTYVHSHEPHVVSKFLRDDVADDGSLKESFMHILTIKHGSHGINACLFYLVVSYITSLFGFTAKNGKKICAHA